MRIRMSRTIAKVKNKITAKKTMMSAWCVVFNKEGNILIAKRSANSNNPNLLNFPGGGTEKGETTLKTALRELREEMGISETKVKLIGKHSISLKGKVFVYYLMYVGKAKVIIDKKEASKFWWMTLDKALETPNNKLHLPTKTFLRDKKGVKKIEGWIKDDNKPNKKTLLKIQKQT